MRYANERDLGKVEFIEEKVSGTVSWKKRKIAEIVEQLTEGDNIVVSELSRIGRSMLEIMEVLRICLEKEQYNKHRIVFLIIFSCPIAF